MIVQRPDWGSYKAQLKRLFEASFAKPMSTDYLDWRYYDNDRELLLFSIEKSGTAPVADLAASYSAFPVVLERNGQALSAALSMTTMTHPDWRGRGLFPRLATELYAFAAERGVALVWGFPNANSHATFQSKLGWQDIYEIPTLQLRYDVAVVAAMRSSERVERDDAFVKTYPAMPADGLVRSRRDQRYLTWRYAKNPVHEYRTYVLSRDSVLSESAQVTSYVVTKRYGEGVDLIDIQCADRDEARVLLEHIIRVSAGDGARFANCWAPTHHWLHGVLERLGFKNTVPVTYVGGRILQAAAFDFDIFDHRNWYIQMGDSDVY